MGEAFVILHAMQLSFQNNELILLISKGGGGEGDGHDGKIMKIKASGRKLFRTI